MEILQTTFRTILNMSLTASYVIFAILILRLFLQKAPKRYSYWLWSAAAFRLASPVSFTSIASVFNAAALFAKTAPQAPASVASGAAPAVLPAAPAVLPAPVFDTVVPAADHVLNGTLPAATPAASTDPVSIWLTLGTVVWLAGVLLLLGYGVISYLRLKRQTASAVKLSDGVYESERVKSPFILGFIRPRILLPFGLSASDLSAILEHERYHLSRYDHLVKPLAYLLLAVHWFNPLCWLAFHLMGRDMEMRCDEHVLTIEKKQAYSRTLLRVASPTGFPSPSPLAFGEVSVKQRIRNTLKWKKPTVLATVMTAILSIALILSLAANPLAENNAAAPVLPEGTFVVDALLYEQTAEADSPFYLLSGVIGLKDGSFTFTDPQADRPSIAASYDGDNGAPLRPSDWNNYFAGDPVDLSDYAETAEYAVSDSIRLFQMDGEIWLASFVTAEPGDTGTITALFRLMPEGEAKNTARWIYRSDASGAETPGARLNVFFDNVASFEMQATGGLLSTDAAPDGQDSIALKGIEPLYWSPDGPEGPVREATLSYVALIAPTLPDGPETSYSGTVEIRGEATKAGSPAITYRFVSVTYEKQRVLQTSIDGPGVTILQQTAGDIDPATAPLTGSYVFDSLVYMGPQIDDNPFNRVSQWFTFIENRLSFSSLDGPVGNIEPAEDTVWTPVEPSPEGTLYDTTIALDPDAGISEFRLNTRYRALRVNGDIWLAVFSDADKVENIYRLAPFDAQYNRAVWLYSPVISSYWPGIEIEFPPGKTRLELQTSAGSLFIESRNNTVAYDAGKAVTAGANDRVRWSPHATDGADPLSTPLMERADIVYTAYKGDDVLAEGTVRIDVKPANKESNTSTITFRGAPEDDYILEPIITETGGGMRLFKRPSGRTLNMINVPFSDEPFDRTNLELSVSDAIRRFATYAFRSGDYMAEAHHTIASEWRHNTVEVHALTDVMAFQLKNGKLVATNGGSSAAVITFRINEDGTYTPTLYWEPDDGLYYRPSMLTRFSPELMATVDALAKADSAAFRQKLIADAVAHFDYDPQPEIRQMLAELAALPKPSEGDRQSRQDWLQREFSLINYGEFTLDYIASSFMRERFTPEEADVAADLFRTLLGDEAVGSADLKGVAFFNDWLMHVERLEENGRSYMEVNMPKTTALLDRLSE